MPLHNRYARFRWIGYYLLVCRRKLHLSKDDTTMDIVEVKENIQHSTFYAELA